MVAGNRLKKMEIFTSEHIKMIKKLDLEDMFGLMVAYTKETLHRMLSNFFIYFRHGKGKLIYTDGR